MSKVAIQKVVVTEETGDDLTAIFQLLVLADRDVRGTIVYKTEVNLPSWQRYLPGLDDLDETILAETFNESVIIDMDPVQGG